MKSKINIGICSIGGTSWRSVGDFAQNETVGSKVWCGTEQCFLWCKGEENILCCLIPFWLELFRFKRLVLGRGEAPFMHVGTTDKKSHGATATPKQ